MSIGTTTPSVGSPSPASLLATLMNLFACPGDVFEEIVAAPPRLAHWLVPTLLACLVSIILLGPATGTEETPGPISEMLAAGNISPVDGEALTASWQAISAVSICASILVGTFWSAFVIWCIGRVCLKTRFAYLKALEFAGLAQMILVLGAIVTTLLILATGNLSARPALSLLVLKIPVAHGFRAFTESLNFFHIWSTTVLAVALARLSGVSFKEAAFWVFGYWFALRAVLMLLA